MEQEKLQMISLKHNQTQNYVNLSGHFEAQAPVRTHCDTGTSTDQKIGVVLTKQFSLGI